MEKITISTLSIRILLKCHEKPVSMHNVSQFYKPFPKEERDKAIAELIKNHFIDTRMIPKPNTRRTPTYYLITDKGIKWVKEYLNLFKK